MANKVCWVSENVAWPYHIKEVLFQSWYVVTFELKNDVIRSSKDIWKDKRVDANLCSVNVDESQSVVSYFVS